MSDLRKNTLNESLSNGGDQAVEHALSVLDEKAEQERQQQVWAPFYDKKHQQWHAYLSELLAEWQSIQKKVNKQERLTSDELATVERMKQENEREFFLNGCHLIGQACDNALKHAYQQGSTLDLLQIESRKRVAKERIELDGLKERTDEVAERAIEVKEKLIVELDLDECFANVKERLKEVRERTIALGQAIIADMESIYQPDAETGIKIEALQSKLDEYTQEKNQLLKMMKQTIKESSELQQLVKSILYKPVITVPPALVGRPANR